MTALLAKIKSNWNIKFKTTPSFFVKSAGRINLIGEHTDYNDGFVLPASIDKGIYIAIEKTLQKTQVVALDKNEEFVFSVKENQEKFPSGAWQNYVIGVVEEIKKTGSALGNFRAIFCGDIPQGAGLSSSAALENAFVFALNELFDLQFSRQEMLKIAQQAEHNYAGVQCGIMDQFSSMMGEKDEVMLLDCRSLDFQSKKIDLGEYQLVLLNSGVSHQLADSEYNKRRAECESAVEKIQAKYPIVKSLRDVSFDMLNLIKLNEIEYKRAKYIVEENQRVLDAVDCLGKGQIVEFGEILFAAHRAMKDEYEITCTETDFLVEKARENPYVLGARQMGGGFGGCTLNVVRKDKIDKFVSAIEESYFKLFNKQIEKIAVKIEKGTTLVVD